MASQSKEENVLKLILQNSPLKEWHFEEIIREAKITKASANKWLKKYVSDGVLTYQKEKGKFPYFTAGSNNHIYCSLKRVYALQQLHRSGLIPKLLSLKKAKTIILFGSTIRGDWYEKSDIDIFIFGDISGFNKKIYEIQIGKYIDLHVFQNKKEIQDVKTGLMKNIVNGYIVKGDIQDIIEVA